MFRVLPGPLHAVLWGRGGGLSSADSIRECCALVSEMKNFLWEVKLMAWQLLQCAQSLCAPSKLRAFSDAGHAVQSPQGRHGV